MLPTATASNYDIALPRSNETASIAANVMRICNDTSKDISTHIIWLGICRPKNCPSGTQYVNRISITVCSNTTKLFCLYSCVELCIGRCSITQYHNINIITIRPTNLHLRIMIATTINGQNISNNYHELVLRGCACSRWNRWFPVDDPKRSGALPTPYSEVNMTQKSVCKYTNN